LGYDVVIESTVVEVARDLFPARITNIESNAKQYFINRYNCSG
jgi:hypothetical protein